MDYDKFEKRLKQIKPRSKGIFRREWYKLISDVLEYPLKLYNIMLVIHEDVYNYRLELIAADYKIIFHLLKIEGISHSISRIARATRLSLRCVYNRIRYLEENKVVKTFKSMRGRTGRCVIIHPRLIFRIKELHNEDGLYH